MKLFLGGLSHKTAPVEIRERVAIDERSLPDALRRLCQSDAVGEGMILSTCNRVEVAVTAADDSDPNDFIRTLLEDYRQMEPGSISPYWYALEGEEAIRHLFRVASSLESMVLGEPQILGQLKTAYAVAKANGTLSGLLDNIVTRAFSVAKRIRSETGIGRSAVSVSFAAVELAREIFGTLNHCKVMIIGAGKMSELAARHLRRSGASQVFVSNRTHDRAQELAKLFDAAIVDYNRFVEKLPEIDIVITSSGAPHYILTAADIRKVIETRRNRPVFLIDIAVPRNIEPAVNEIDNVFLYDIDDLQKVVDTNLEDRKKEAQHAFRIIDDELHKMMARLQAREVAPTIVSLQEQLELIRKSEISRIRTRLGQLTLQQEEAIEALTRGIVNKIAHGPISELRRGAGHPDGVHIVDTIRKVFHLEPK